MNNESYKLNIPLVSQPRKSVECGIACLKMVLEYLGFEDTYEQIKNSMQMYDVGTSSFDLANYLLARGVKTTLIYCHPFFFNLNMGKSNTFKNKQDLLDYLHQIWKNKKAPKHFYYTLPGLIKFIENDGKLIIDYPKRSHIEKALAKNLPVISGQMNGLLGTLSPEQQVLRNAYTGHYNVITGIKNDTIFVNDSEEYEPDFEKRLKYGGYDQGGKQSYNIDDFLYAVIANTMQDMDNGALVIPGEIEN